MPGNVARVKVTKYEHSTMVIESSGEYLVIDPGVFLASLPELDDIVAIVITHEHADHWSADNLHRLVTRNPKARLFGPQGVATAATGFDITVVKDGDVVEVAPFTLKFFGDTHAVIHESIPVVDNISVLVNDLLYYAGDSYNVPPVKVDTLAAPIGAPWLKIGDSMDYVLAIKPRHAFSVHDMTLSAAGKGMTNERIKWATEQGGGEFFALEPGDSLDL